MKKIITIGLLLCCHSAFSQVNLSDLERKEGLWYKLGETQPYTGTFEQKYADNTLKGTGEFLKGQLTGLRTLYYPNGNKMMERYYKNAIPNGYSKEYYENGTLKQEGELLMHKGHGKWLVYYDTGVKQAEINYKNGIKSEEYYQYAPDGTLVKQLYYTNGKAGYSPEFMKLVTQAQAISGSVIPKQTIPLYDKAIAINPTVAKAYFSRGTAYSNALDFKKSISDFNKAIELNPEYMEAYANRGNSKINIHTAQGNTKLTKTQTASACLDFKKAKELGDTSTTVQDMLYLYCK